MHSGSSIKDFVKCQQLYKYRHIDKRGLPILSPALSFGTAFHKMMEYKLRGEPVPWDELADTIHPLEASNWANCEEVMRDWEPPRDWKILKIEEPLHNAWLTGRLDAIIEWNGKIWSLQWKTTGQQAIAGSIVEQVRTGFHENIYQELLVHAGYSNIGGTIVGVYTKLPRHKRVNGKLVELPLDVRKSASFVVLPVSRTREEHEAAITNVSVIVGGISAVQGGRATAARNTDACYNSFNRGRCPYYPVCFEGADLHSPPYEDLPERY